MGAAEKAGRKAQISSLAPRLIAAAIALAVTASGMTLALTGYADQLPPNNFEIDGDLVSNSNTKNFGDPMPAVCGNGKQACPNWSGSSGSGIDWDALDGFGYLGNDLRAGAGDQFGFQNAQEGVHPNAWVIDLANGVPDDQDLTHAYLHVDESDLDALKIYLGFARVTGNGALSYSVELNQKQNLPVYPSDFGPASDANNVARMKIYCQLDASGNVIMDQPCSAASPFPNRTVGDIRLAFWQGAGNVAPTFGDVKNGTMMSGAFRWQCTAPTIWQRALETAAVATPGRAAALTAISQVTNGTLSEADYLANYFNKVPTNQQVTGGINWSKKEITANCWVPFANSAQAFRGAINSSGPVRTPNNVGDYVFPDGSRGFGMSLFSEMLVDLGELFIPPSCTPRFSTANIRTVSTQEVDAGQIKDYFSLPADSLGTRMIVPSSCRSDLTIEKLVEQWEWDSAAGEFVANRRPAEQAWNFTATSTLQSGEADNGILLERDLFTPSSNLGSQATQATSAAPAGDSSTTYSLEYSHPKSLAIAEQVRPGWDLVPQDGQNAVCQVLRRYQVDANGRTIYARLVNAATGTLNLLDRQVMFQAQDGTLYYYNSAGTATKVTDYNYRAIPWDCDLNQPTCTPSGFAPDPQTAWAQLPSANLSTNSFSLWPVNLGDHAWCTVVNRGEDVAIPAPPIELAGSYQTGTAWRVAKSVVDEQQRLVVTDANAVEVAYQVKVEAVAGTEFGHRLTFLVPVLNPSSEAGTIKVSLWQDPAGTIAAPGVQPINLPVGGTPRGENPEPQQVLGAFDLPAAPSPGALLYVKAELAGHPELTQISDGYDFSLATQTLAGATSRTLTDLLDPNGVEPQQLQLPGFPSGELVLGAASVSGPGWSVVTDANQNTTWEFTYPHTYHAPSGGWHLECDTFRNVATLDQPAAGESATETVRICPTPQRNLQITKTAQTETVSPGQAAVFTVTVTNEGPGSATDVVVTDSLPLGLIYQSHTAPSGANCPLAAQSVVGTLAPGANNRSIVWQLGNLAAGQSCEVTVTAQMAYNATTPQTNWVRVVTADEETIGSDVEQCTDQMLIGALVGGAVPSGLSAPCADNLDHAVVHPAQIAPWPHQDITVRKTVDGIAFAQWAEGLTENQMSALLAGVTFDLYGQDEALTPFATSEAAKGFVPVEASHYEATLRPEDGLIHITQNLNPGWYVLVEKFSGSAATVFGDIGSIVFWYDGHGTTVVGGNRPDSVGYFDPSADYWVNASWVYGALGGNGVRLFTRFANGLVWDGTKVTNDPASGQANEVQGIVVRTQPPGSAASDWREYAGFCAHVGSWAYSGNHYDPLTLDEPTRSLILSAFNYIADAYQPWWETSTNPHYTSPNPFSDGWELPNSARILAQMAVWYYLPADVSDYKVEEIRVQDPAHPLNQYTEADLATPCEIGVGTATAQTCKTAFGWVQDAVASGYTGRNSIKGLFYLQDELRGDLGQNQPMIIPILEQYSGVVDNTEYTEIRLFKLDHSVTRPTQPYLLYGATFQLYDQDPLAEANSGLDPVQTLVVTNGVLTVRVRPGDYWLREAVAPMGMAMNSGLIWLRVARDGSVTLQGDYGSGTFQCALGDGGYSCTPSSEGGSTLALGNANLPPALAATGQTLDSVDTGQVAGGCQPSGTQPCSATAPHGAVAITNYALRTLPSVGGGGTDLLLLCGMATLAMGAVSALWLRKSPQVPGLFAVFTIRRRCFSRFIV